MRKHAVSAPVVLAIAICPIAITDAEPVGSVFTYQGRLDQAGQPFDGPADLMLRLFNAEAGGLQVGPELSFIDLDVVDGLLTVDLDFGAGAFLGDDRWIEIQVGATVLTPRQPVTPAPYALFAYSGNEGPEGPMGPPGEPGQHGSDSLWQISRSNMYYNSGNIGIGTSSPGSLLEVTGNAELRSIVGYHAGETGTAFGVQGQAASTAGSGVYGYATSTTGGTRGVYGRSNSDHGIGVFGSANASAGSTVGVYGQAISSEGVGVYGRHNTTIGTAAGVLGETNSTSIGAAGVHGRLTNPNPGVVAAGVRGENPSTGGVGVGVWGSHSGSGWGVLGTTIDGYGVIGPASGTTELNYGVRGETPSTRGIGVYGEATAATGSAFGGRFESEGTQGMAVYATASATGGRNYAVRGWTGSPDGYAGYFEGGRNYFDGNAGFGTTSPSYPVHANSFTSRAINGRHDNEFGEAVAGHAVAFDRTSAGVQGLSEGTNGRGVWGIAGANSGVNYGVYGSSASRSGWDFYAGGIGGNYGATSSRRWKNNIEPIDDPLKKLGQLRGVYFDWDEEHGGQHDVGMIAEEVGEVLPEIVNYEQNGVDADGMDYSKMTPLLVEAVDALRAENQSLQDQNQEIARRMERLEALVEKMATVPINGETK